MSSEEKKGPPGTGDPQVLGDQDEDEDLEIAVDDDPPDLVLRSRANEAYAELKDIMRERKDSWFTAFGRNLARNGKKLPRIITHVVTGGIVTIGVTLLTGDPLFGLTTGTAVGVTAPPAVSTTRLRRSRLSEHRRSYPDVPEFHDLWAVTAYEFMLMVRGYHLRTQAIHRLRKLASQLIEEPKRSEAALRTAAAFVGLLRAWHPGLVEIDRVMFEYQANSMEMYADAEGQDAIRQIQPLKEGLYEWLILDPEVIVPGKEQELFERDIYEIASFQDMSDAVDPYSALQREQEREE
ncbi:MAG TPA: hypothetical protein VL283_01740 [Candidatus Baltobacteraceae bacterium]|nr:hypothetical protein [Candidatus Baltobacteraceae bacterium]